MNTLIPMTDVQAPVLNLATVGGGQLQNFCRYIAAAMIFAWIAFVIFQYLFPSRRIGSAIRQIARPVVLVMAAIGLACLIDLNLVDMFIKLFFKAGSAIGDLIRQFTGQAGGVSNSV